MDNILRGENMKQKHRNDQNHSKNGRIGGNPRYAKARGTNKAQRPKDKQCCQLSKSSGFKDTESQ